MKKQIEKEDDRRKKKEERIKIEQLNIVVQITVAVISSYR